MHCQRHSERHYASLIAAWGRQELLELGEQIGDVRTERWRNRAGRVIQSLRTRVFSATRADDAAAESEGTDEKCGHCCFDPANARHSPAACPSLRIAGAWCASASMKKGKCCATYLAATPIMRVRVAAPNTLARDGRSRVRAQSASTIGCVIAKTARCANEA